MSQINSFNVTFQEDFPSYIRSPIEEHTAPISFDDTRTVAIIGLGKRTETVVSVAKGNGLDGEPQNFDPRLIPTGRYFKTVSYPVDPSRFEIYRGLGAQELVLEKDYYLDDKTGYFILFTPLVTGERLIVKYISFSDINHPQLFTKEQLKQLYVVHGSPSSENTLASAAEIAFANGAPRIVTVQGDHTGRDPYWSQSYQVLENVRAYMIVPVQNGYYSQVAAFGTEHVRKMSETPYRRERILLIGERDASVDLPFDSLPRSAVSDYNLDERVLFIGADLAKTVIVGETTDATGGYLAAGVAGLWSSFEYVPTTLYKKELARIVLKWPNENFYSEQQLRTIANDGVTLLVKNNGAATVGRFVMTLNNGNPVDTEPSIWRIRDYIAIVIRNALETNFVGKPLIADLLQDIEIEVERLLKGLISQGIITEYANIRVEVNSQEPRQTDVSFDIAPVFPLNDIRLGIRVTSQL